MIFHDDNLGATVVTNVNNLMVVDVFDEDDNGEYIGNVSSTTLAFKNDNGILMVNDIYPGEDWKPVVSSDGDYVQEMGEDELEEVLETLMTFNKKNKFGQSQSFSF